MRLRGTLSVRRCTDAIVELALFERRHAGVVQYLFEPFPLFFGLPRSFHYACDERCRTDERLIMLTSLRKPPNRHQDTISILSRTTTTDPQDVESFVDDAIMAVDATIVRNDPAVLARWAMRVAHRLDADNVGDLVVAACTAVQKGFALRGDRSDLPAISRLLLSARHLTAEAILSDRELAVSA